MSKIIFCIYLAGNRSGNAPMISAFEKACDELLETGTFKIKIVDVIKQASVAEKSKILAIPTIIREKPLPERRIIGDIRHDEKAVSALKFLTDEL